MLNKVLTVQVSAADEEVPDVKAYSYLEFYFNGETAVIIGYNSDSMPNDGKVIIPEKVKSGNNTYTVTKIDTDAFCRCTNLTSIELPNSITEIDTNAFMGCTSLTSVELKASQVGLDENVFSDCGSLKVIYAPENANYINEISGYTIKYIAEDSEVSIVDNVVKNGETFVVSVDASKFGGNRSEYEDAKYLEDVSIVVNDTAKYELTDYYVSEDNNIYFNVKINSDSKADNKIRAGVTAYNWGDDTYDTAKKLYYATDEFAIQG